MGLSDNCTTITKTFLHFGVGTNERWLKLEITYSLDDLKIGDVWMMKCGTIVQITVLHGGHTDKPFQVRRAGSFHNCALGFHRLDYKISKG